MRRRATLLLTVIIGIVAVATLASITSKKPIDVPATLATNPHPASMIDGATNPQRIPDRVAYSLLFSMIANHRTEIEKNRIGAYIRQLGLSDADSTALIATSDEYMLRVGVIDNQANAIMMRYHPNHPPLSSDDKNQLQELNKQSGSIVNDVAASSNIV